MDRTLGANKPVDPATRLSELLAQSLEELTRPFDPANPHPVPAREVAQAQRPAEPPAPDHTPEESRIDADKALAELEAELFAAAKQVDRETSAEATEVPAEHGEEPVAAQEPAADEAVGADQPEAVAALDADKAADAPNEADIVPAPLVPDAPARTTKARPRR